MQRFSVFTLVCLFILSVGLVYSQDEVNTEITCEDYIATLRQEIFDLTAVFEDYLGYQTAEGVYDLQVAMTATIEDYQLWVDRRTAWENTDLPTCALMLHADVIAMYANIGDIYTYTLYSLTAPNNEDVIGWTEQAYERTETSILEVTYEIETYIDDEPLDLNGSLAALDFVWNLYQFEVPEYAENG